MLQFALPLNLSLCIASSGVTLFQRQAKGSMGFIFEPRGRLF